MTDKRLPFLSRCDQLDRQRQWLIDLDRLLEPTEPPSTGAEVADRVDRYLVNLIATVRLTGNDFDQEVACHINQTFRSRWWGLFICYQVEGLPRTNNEMETFLRRLKTGQRRVTGRKKVHDFIVRYGRYAAFCDPQESHESLLTRLSQVSHDEFLRERADLAAMQERTAKRHRFRHRQRVFLQELEARWADACAQPQAKL